MSRVLPVNISTITQAVIDLLKRDANLEGVAIERSEELNKTERPKGWIGVYRTRVRYPLRTIGRGTGYRKTEVSLVIAIQRSHARSGTHCEDALEELIQKVGAAILTDESFGGTVDALDDVEIQYTDYWRSNTTGVFTQTAFLYVTGSVNVSVFD